MNLVNKLEILHMKLAYSSENPISSKLSDWHRHVVEPSLKIG